MFLSCVTMSMTHILLVLNKLWRRSSTPKDCLSRIFMPCASSSDHQVPVLQIHADLCPSDVRLDWQIFKSMNKNNSPAGVCLVYNTLSLQKLASPILPSPIIDICQIKDDGMFGNCHHSYSIHWPPPGRVRPVQSARELGSPAGEDKTHTDKR